MKNLFDVEDFRKMILPFQIKTLVIVKTAV